MYRNNSSVISCVLDCLTLESILCRLSYHDSLTAQHRIQITIIGANRFTGIWNQDTGFAVWV